MKWHYPILAIPIKLLSRLPLPVLYLLSDFVYVILYYVAGYRRKVVYENLHRSFPEKSEAEINLITKQYYCHMVDVMVETLKLSTITKSELLKRCTFTNINLVEQFNTAGQNLIFVLGHMGNWEWLGPAFSLHSTRKLYALYHPLNNKFFDWFMHDLRTRFGGGLIPMNHLLRDMVKLKNELCAIAFISDQTPAPENALWIDFLNQDTPVFSGTEKIATRFNYPVIFASVTKQARGFYSITFKLITATPADMSKGYITHEHSHLLEESIKATPHIWLWSHRRWKHTRKAKGE